MAEHAGHGSDLSGGESGAEGNRFQSRTAEEHIAHRGDLGGVEAREVERGEGTAVVEHVEHRGDVLGVEVPEAVDGGECRAAVEPVAESRQALVVLERGVEVDGGECRRGPHRLATATATVTVIAELEQERCVGILGGGSARGQLGVVEERQGGLVSREQGVGSRSILDGEIAWLAEEAVDAGAGLVLYVRCVIRAIAADQFFTAGEHLRAAGDGVARPVGIGCRIDGLEVSAVVEHACRVRDIRHVEAREVELGEARTAGEHACHGRHVLGAERREVYRRETRTAGEHARHGRHVLGVEVREVYRRERRATREPSGQRLQTVIVAEGAVEGHAGERGTRPALGYSIAVQSSENGDVVGAMAGHLCVVEETDRDGLAVGVLRHYGVRPRLRLVSEVAGIGGAAVWMGIGLVVIVARVI